MGVAFAEVSPDFCIDFNTGCYRSPVFAAARWLCHCDASGMYAGGVGMGAILRFHFSYSARVACRTLWPAAGGDALFDTGISP